MSVFAITAAISALLFALASWLIVEHWVYPRLLATLHSFGDQGLSIAAQRDAHPVLRMCLPYLCIAVAQLVGSLALGHPRLARASFPRRTVFLGIAIFAGWLTAVVALLPPGLTTVLWFTPPVLILLLLSWLAASPIAWLLRRRRRA